MIQKKYLIIPMGGIGKRFLDCGYTTYKALLPIDKKTNIFDGIIRNFNKKNFKIIVLVNKVIWSQIKKKISEEKYKNVIKILINPHKKGPLYSLYLSYSKLKKIINQKDQIYISYSDILWKWNLSKINKIININNVSTVFTHSGFHPHININNKSDFCKVEKKIIKKISEKKPFGLDYKKEELAIGCYFIKSFSYLDFFFNNYKFTKKKEIYLLELVNFLIKNNFRTNILRINKFAHLGIPSQYVDFVYWKKYFTYLNKISNNNLFTEYKCYMLINGKGKRVESITKYKFLLKINNKPIFKKVLEYFNCYKNILITNKEYKNKLKKTGKYNFYEVNQSNSMFETIILCSNILKKDNNYFLTSCDCYGFFDQLKLKYCIDNFDFDLIIFSFDLTYTQKYLNNAHTQLVTKNNYIKDIIVKSNYNANLKGQAGFFWVKNGNIFNYIHNFKQSKNYRSITREVILDDYFKYLIKRRLAKAIYINLDHYIHVGSKNEYEEYVYWENFFKK